MPGITGLISFKDKAEKLKPLFEDLIKSLKLHSWYQVQRLHLPGASLACVRTGILNKQVLFSHNGVHVIIHGEIYNDDLTNRNQAQYVAECYREKGRSFAEKLNGSFAIVLFDENKKVAFLATDRVGSKPILYWQDNDTLFFAPQVKSFLTLQGYSFKADESAIADVLSNNFMTGRRSLIKNIYYLDNASVCEISDSSIKISPYWTYTFNENNQDFSPKNARKELSRLLLHAVERRLRTSHNYALSLSGGYDSRALVGCCLQANKSVKTFSYGSAKKNFGDSALAARIARKAGFEHFHCFYDSSHYLQTIKHSVFLREGMGNVIEEWPVWEALRKDHKIDIILAGDECFGWQDVYIDSEETMFKTLGIELLSNFHVYSKILFPEAFDKLSRMSHENLSQLSSQCILKDFHNRKDYFYLNQRLFSLLIWRHAISTEVEVRNPWLDNDILNFMMTVPVKYRRGKKLFKHTVTSLFPELFKIDVSRRSDALTRNDFHIWMNQYKEEIEHGLFHGHSAIDELINSDALREFINQADKSDSKRNSSFSKIKDNLIQIIHDSDPGLYFFLKKMYTLYKRAPINVLNEELSVIKVISRIMILRQILQGVCL